MAGAPICCPKCGTMLPRQLLSLGTPFSCTLCRTSLEVMTFPAYEQGYQAARRGETIVADDQSTCFYHPRKKAAVVCDECGRFLCSLCDIPMGERHVCPSCVESQAKVQMGDGRTPARSLNDSLAMALSLVPVLITAFAAFYITLRHWGDAPGPLPRTKARFVLAIVFSFLQLAMWGWIIYDLSKSGPSSSSSFMD